MIELKSTKLLFLYRTILFKFSTFKTNNNELKTIVKALNIKNRKQRITYIYDETISLLNEYYSQDLCQFIDGKCIVQRKNNSKSTNGCCRRCLIVTEKGCPSVNITCKLIYCKTAAKNIKLLKFNELTILKCLSIRQRLIILASTMMVREEVIKNLQYGIIYTVLRELFNEIKYSFYRKKSAN